MRQPARNKSKPASKKTIKLPKDVVPLEKKPGKVIKNQNPINQKVEELCGQLVDSEWHPHCGRPKGNVVGFYAVYRWYPKDKNWVLIFIGKGIIRDKINGHFDGKERTPIGSYLSSFPKTVRKDLLWLKWIKDPYHPYESVSLDDMISALMQKYTEGERPAFNIPAEEEALPKGKLFNLFNFC